MLSPEILAEQVMWYVIGAIEMIPTLEPIVQPYSAILVPKWPHFYTWLLQAAGYLLLDAKKKKLILISEQYDDLKNILIDTNTYWPVFGTTREQSKKNREQIQKQLKAKLSEKTQKDVSKNIAGQLPFIRVIMDVEEYIHIGIGPQVSDIKKKSLLTWIKKNITDHNIVLLTNIELSETTKKTKNNEQKEIADIITKQKTPSSSLVNIFKHIHKITKQETEVIAYVNPRDFWDNWSLTTRYVCAVT